MSSRLIQVTVVPTATVSVAGPKLKLSIFTSVVVACWAFAVKFGDPANNRANASIIVIAKPTTHTVLLFIVVSSLNFGRIDLWPRGTFRLIPALSQLPPARAGPGRNS